MRGDYSSYPLDTPLHDFQTYSIRRKTKNYNLQFSQHLSQNLFLYRLLKLLIIVGRRKITETLKLSFFDCTILQRN